MPRTSTSIRMILTLRDTRSWSSLSGWKLNNLRMKSKDFSIWKGEATLKSLKKKWDLHYFKRCHCEKNLLRTNSFTFMFKYQCCRWPSDRLHMNSPFSCWNGRCCSSGFPENRWFVSFLISIVNWNKIIKSCNVKWRQQEKQPKNSRSN